jgi:hypothetical protein
MKLPDIFLKFNLTKIFLIFTYSICWFSISTNFQDFLFYKDINFNDIFLIDKILSTNFINFLRQTFLYLSFIFLVAIFLILKKKLFLKDNFIFYILILYFLLQLPGLFNTDNNYDNCVYVISSLTIILTIILINYYFSHNEKMIFILISFLILNVVFLITFLPSIYLFITDAPGSIYGGVIENNIQFANKTSPRSSGLARTALIQLLLSVIIFQFYNKKKLLIFLKIFFISVIFLYQSRTVISLTLFVLIVFFIHENSSAKGFIKNVILFFLIPIIICMSILKYGEYKNALTRTNQELHSKGFGLNAADKPLKKYLSGNLRNPMTRDWNPKDFSSGRFSDWNKIYKKFEVNNFLFGYGAQGDRYLINQSASNGLIYAFISSGIIGLFFFITFSIMVFFKSIKKLLSKNKHYNYKYIYHLLTFIILARSVLESSYAVFSIDLVIFLTALCLGIQSKSQVEK